MLRLLAFIVAFGLWASSGSAQRVALIVGVGAYSAVPALANPPRDARAMAEVLRRLGFETDLVLNPDRTTMERAIRAFGSRARRSDAALFFYAGHAVEFGGRNFLVPVTHRPARWRWM